MILLTTTGSLIQVVTASSGSVKVYASWADNDSGTINPGSTNTAEIAGAATTEVLASPASAVQRRLKYLSVRNDHASTSNLVTIQHTDATNVEPLWKGTLLAQEEIVYSEAAGWQYFDANGAIKASATKINILQRVTGDIVYSTAATLADVTGLTCPVQSGKHYAFECHLYHISAATTTGARFGVNGPAMTAMVVANISGVTNSVTAAAISIGSAAAVNTVISAQTTGSSNITITMLSGWINPSASGTFAIRATAEVAANMTVKAGSWLRVRECDN